MADSVDTAVCRRRIHIDGIVQGVGFRPFVYRLARECRIGGTVSNSEAGVDLDVEGFEGDLDRFVQRIRSEAPALAVIERIRIVDVASDLTASSADDIADDGSRTFRIVESARHAARHAVRHAARHAGRGLGGATTHISPDAATCDDCLRELFDPADRRFHYPFVNCTNCGPRYTIVRSIPYDRPNTSMDEFALCEACAREYNDPEDRRFHAQPNACAECGPSLRFVAGRRSTDWDAFGLGDPNNLNDPNDPNDPNDLNEQAVSRAVTALNNGAIVALRGVGGFHLAVDATNESAVRELRRRKRRAHKPFALMARDVDAVRQWCTVSDEEVALLGQPGRPIVLLQRRPDAGDDPDQCRNQSQIAPSVAPGQTTLGFMLPYTPLHHLVLHGSVGSLVMTSANLAEEPIAIGNEEALDRLGAIADYFVLHDREILQRCDDSVVRVVRGKPTHLRRSRGYVPAPVRIPTPARESVLAVGGELKNTIALARGRDVFLSQHVGDLDNPAAFKFFADSIDHLEALLEIEPEYIACDLHPEYLSTKWASRQALPIIRVQHHHAHFAAVLAENDVVGEALGIILDGTGYGPDGTIWGGELLRGSAESFARVAWLSPFPLPGGEAAIRQPWRTAIGLLYNVYGPDVEGLGLPVVDAHRDKLPTILRMIDRAVNSPLTSSVGRLFDAVAAMCACRTVVADDEWEASGHAISYEAQAAILLEAAATESVGRALPEPYPSGATRGALSLHNLVRGVVDDLVRGTDARHVAARFHATVADMFVAAAAAARESSNINRVGLSGGAFQNALLLDLISVQLERHGFEVITHSRVPANDGGLAFGQCAVAAAQLHAVD